MFCVDIQIIKDSNSLDIFLSRTVTVNDYDQFFRLRFVYVTYMNFICKFWLFLSERVHVFLQDPADVCFPEDFLLDLQIRDCIVSFQTRISTRINPDKGVQNV